MMRPASDSGRLPEQSVRGRPEEKELPRAAPLATALVDLATEHSKELWQPLDLVQNHQPLGMKVQVPSRIDEAGSVAGILEIQVKTVRRLGRDVPSERGLADLARPEERHRRRLVEVLQNSPLVSSRKHPC